MTVVSNDLTKTSHVVKYEQAREHAFSRSEFTAVQMPAARVIGEVLVYDSTTDNRWETPATGITTGVVGILVDAEVYDVAAFGASVVAQLNIVDKAAIAVEPHLVFDAGLNATDIGIIKGLLKAQGVQLVAAVNTKD
jgi:hypothetical protein